MCRQTLARAARRTSIRLPCLPAVVVPTSCVSPHLQCVFSCRRAKAVSSQNATLRCARIRKQAMGDSEREALFMSHANPEDNAFTLWLGAKLTALGYEVFADVLRLRGGEDWERIL